MQADWYLLLLMVNFMLSALLVACCQVVSRVALDTHARSMARGMCGCEAL